MDDGLRTKPVHQRMLLVLLFFLLLSVPAVSVVVGQSESAEPPPEDRAENGLQIEQPAEAEEPGDSDADGDAASNGQYPARADAQEGESIWERLKRYSPAGVGLALVISAVALYFGVRAWRRLRGAALEVLGRGLVSDVEDRINSTADALERIARHANGIRPEMRRLGDTISNEVSQREQEATEMRQRLEALRSDWGCVMDGALRVVEPHVHFEALDAMSAFIDRVRAALNRGAVQAASSSPELSAELLVWSEKIGQGISASNLHAWTAAMRMIDQHQWVIDPVVRACLPLQQDEIDGPTFFHTARESLIPAVIGPALSALKKSIFALGQDSAAGLARDDLVGLERELKSMLTRIGIKIPDLQVGSSSWKQRMAQLDRKHQVDPPIYWRSAGEPEALVDVRTWAFEPEGGRPFPVPRSVIVTAKQ